MNLLSKGAKTYAAVMEKITFYLMAILRRTKGSPWLLVKTAITMAAKMKGKTKTVFRPSVLEQRFKGQVPLGN